jgi:cell division protein FtsI/penicillin-binding protein 2
VLLVGRLATIQIAQGAYYAKLSVSEVQRTLSVASLRGGIYDRHGAILAISSPTSMVVADDFQITHPHAEALALAPFLKEPAARIEPMLRRHTGYVVLTSSLDVATGDRLASHYFDGIVVLPSSKRTMPNGTIGTSLIGEIS